MLSSFRAAYVAVAKRNLDVRPAVDLDGRLSQAARRRQSRLDAEVLLAVAAGCQRIDLYTRFDEPAPEALRTSFRELVRRRAEGMPVAYLVGRREFYSLSFRVTPDVLDSAARDRVLGRRPARPYSSAGCGRRGERGRRRHRLGHHCHLRGQVCAPGPGHGDQYQSAALAVARATPKI